MFACKKYERVTAEVFHIIMRTSEFTIIKFAATGMITDARKSVLRMRGFAQLNGQFPLESL
ncbi:hypothetical protein KU73_03925 [Pectobacterium wasabiae]|uniref:Transposase n=1 Tax=Pectobacterium wasabiae TaxID=55208 RepID=A0AAW3EME6_9GAMM|nr:hypothetical protein A7983_19230 [Pectobacterium wasabiae CFBP 3304]KFX09386.1 hypothetical protein JV38_00195 [Pectobacterium wasabiae]KGA29588.1 hypothetical protein KU73_03925 [Pectobacterium wasabiae]